MVKFPVKICTSPLHPTPYAPLPHTQMIRRVFSTPPPGKLNLPHRTSNITVPVRWTRGCQFNPSETHTWDGHLYLRALRWIWVRWGCRCLSGEGGVNIACLLASPEKSVPKRVKVELLSSEEVSGLFCWPVEMSIGDVCLDILAHVGTNLPPQSQLSVRWWLLVSLAQSRFGQKSSAKWWKCKSKNVITISCIHTCSLSRPSPQD